MPKKYDIKDFIYDLAYVAVLAGIILILIGSFPDLSKNIFTFFKSL